MINQDLIKIKPMSENIDALAELAFSNEGINESFLKIMYALGKFIDCPNIFWVRDSLAEKQRSFIIDARKIHNAGEVRRIVEGFFGKENANVFMQDAREVNRFIALFTNSDLTQINDGIVELEIANEELKEFKNLVRAMRDVVQNDAIQQLLAKAKEDPVLAKSERVMDIKRLSEAFHGRNTLDILNNPNFNDLFEIYRRGQEDLREIVEATSEDMDGILGYFRDEVVYNSIVSLVKKEFSTESLSDGKFHTYMYKLLALISQVESHGEDKPEQYLSFDNFATEVVKEENVDIAQAFIVCGELLRLYPEKELAISLQEYSEAEHTISEAIVNLKKPLESIGNGSIEQISNLNGILKSLALNVEENRFFELDSLKEILVKNTDTTSAYIYLKSLKSPRQEIITAIRDLKALLGASCKERVRLLVKLGEEVIQNPQLAYLKTENGLLGLSQEPAKDLKSINVYLNSVLDKLDSQEHTSDELLKLEAFISMALVTHIAAREVDPNSQSVINTLIKIKSKIAQKISSTDMSELRKSQEYQDFCTFMKNNIEETPGYSRKFWVDPEAAEKMKFPELMLQFIGNKIADPEISLGESVQLIHKNDNLGYEIYEYPESKGEKKKLLLFMTGETTWALFQGLDPQLGLLGDPSILAGATNVISDLTSNMILEGYQDNFKNGEIEFITAGFGNSGSAAAIIGSRIAALNPNVQVRSISAGSTPVITTEDAYNVSCIENFFPIRLKYEADQLVDRMQALGDFSDDLYNTFPLTVRHSEKILDREHHNRMEYGNLQNFLPAMKNPIELRNIYFEISSNLLHGEIHEGLQKLLDGKVEEEKSECLDLTDSLVLQVKEKEKVNEGVLIRWKNWITGKKDELDTSQVQINPTMDVNELLTTIQDLQQAVIQLKNPEIMSTLSFEDAFSLLFIINSRLINTNQINKALGRNPQMIDLLSEIRSLLLIKLKSLPNDVNTKKLLAQNQVRFKSLENSILSSGIESDLIAKDIFRRMKFEDRFLEFLGSKIALQGNSRKGIDKIGCDTYANKLFTDTEKNQYDISLYTPEAADKKQRIVISCNAVDRLGNHKLINGTLYSGDVDIITRATNLKKLVDKDLNKLLFNKGDLNPRDVEIVCTGFGTEGAVATALGCLLAEKYEKEDCDICSFSFGAPPFLTPGDQELFKNKKNFLPIRLLGVDDKRYNLRAQNIDTYKLTEETYYTIPMQFRSVGVTEFGQHTPDLYGDPQNIRAAMHSVHLMREITHDMKSLNPKGIKAPKKAENIARIKIDTRNNLLLELSKKSVEELKKEQPGKIIQTMKYCAELSDSDLVTKEQKAEIKALFDHFIEAIKNEDIREKAPIANSFFQKMINFGYQPQSLFAGKIALQRIVSPELNEAMDNLECAEGDISKKERNELILRIDFYRGLLAGDLNGNRYKGAGGGVNGAVFFKHFESNSTILFPYEEKCRLFLGVLKPHPDTVRERKGLLDIGQMVERGKSVGGMAALLNKADPDRRVNNEIFAYEMYHIFGFKDYIGFPTTLKFPNKTDSIDRPASFCSFIPGLDLVEKHVRNVHGKDQGSNLLDDPHRKYSDKELTPWQMSKIFDYLNGNFDGHEGNAFVKVEDGKLTGAVNFDYDKGSPEKNQKGKVNNHCKWALLEISKKPLTPETRKACLKIFSQPEERILEFLSVARKDDEKCFSANQETLLRQRIRAIQLLVATEGSHLSDFRDWRTDRDFAKLKKIQNISLEDESSASEL